MAAEAADKNIPTELDVTKCTLMPVSDDRSGAILPMLYANGGALGPEDGCELSGLRYFRLPSGWTIVRTSSAYHTWCRLERVNLIAQRGAYLIVDSQGRQRARVFYFRAGFLRGEGFLVRAERYTFRDALNPEGDRMCIEVMDGATVLFKSELIPVLAGSPDRQRYELQYQSVTATLREQLGGDFYGITAEYYN